MPPTKTIAIDLDEVLCPFIQELVHWHNHHYQSNIEFHHFTSYSFADVWGGTHEQAVAKANEFHYSRSLETTQPLPGAKAALAQLKQHYDLVLVTSRPLEHKTYTHNWINQYLPNTFSEIILCNHWVSTGKAIKKSDACAQVGAHLLIDDLPHYIKDVSQNNIQGILFGNYPWNQDITHNNNTTRAVDWEDVLQQLQPETETVAENV